VVLLFVKAVLDLLVAGNVVLLAGAKAWKTKLEREFSGSPLCEANLATHFVTALAH
jgi:hypothetical protein